MSSTCLVSICLAVPLTVQKQKRIKVPAASTAWKQKQIKMPASSDSMINYTPPRYLSSKKDSLVTSCRVIMKWSELALEMDTSFVKFFHNHVHGLRDTQLVSAHVHFGLLWLLVRSVDSCEALDFAFSGLPVQSLRVSSLHDTQGCIDEDFHEGQRGVHMCFARIFTVRSVGRDQTSNNNGTSLGKKLGYFSDATPM